MKRLCAVLVVVVWGVGAFGFLPALAAEEKIDSWKTKKLDGTGTIKNFMLSFEDAVKSLPAEESTALFKEIYFIII